MGSKFRKFSHVKVLSDGTFLIVIIDLHPAANLDSSPVPVRRARSNAARQLPGAAVAAHASWFALPTDWAAAEEKRKPWDPWFIRKG